ncbi:MAG: amidase [Dehalococcoidia bacterium]|nr:amidase [Dehalococcoidia bacterium]
MTQTKTFSLLETTIEDILAAYSARELSARELVQSYLNRIQAFDRDGPKINSVINLNDKALAEADRLDAALKASGPVGPLHGIPVLLKDQMDAEGMPTTLGSVLFKDYYPDQDAFVTAKLKQAGAIILAKVTLGELGGGDTHGTLFGSTRNPYDLERTVGGSSGGSATGVSANFGAVAVGQEAFSSIRRPSAWNSVVGMRPTPGLVSRSGVYAGWPSRTASLGPITRTVRDLATLLDSMAGYDPEDPMTAYGVGQAPPTYLAFLDAAGLRGARIGILRQSMGNAAEPDSEDFAKVTAVFDSAVGELRSAGATVIDPVEIPRLNELLAKRAGEGNDGSFEVYMSRSANPPFKSQQEMTQSPGYVSLRARRAPSPIRVGAQEAHYEYLKAREELMTNVLKVMADNQLDAIVHKSVEHQPTLIKDGVNPPFVSSKGAAHLNTFLIYAASISVPAGFTSDGLPAGITFFGRPYSEPTMLRLAYAYEQATAHRIPPNTTPKLAGEP